MRYILILLVVFFFSLTAYAESSRAAFEAPDVPAVLHQLFGRSAYLATDKIKILEGLPGNARLLSANRFGSDEGRVMLAIDLPGPRKVALLMEPVRARRDAPTPLLAIFELSDQASSIVVPVRLPYVDVRITVVVESKGKLWGAQEMFFIRRASDSMEGGSRGPCDDRSREKLARFTGPALDNLAHVSYFNKTGVPLIAVSLQNEMHWEPVLDTRNCTLAEPRAIRSVQLEYAGTVVAEAELGPGIAQPNMMLALPSARIGAPLTLRWQDTRGQRYAYATTVQEAHQSGVLPLHTASMNGDLEAVQRLLAAGVDMNATLPNGWTALGFAAANNQLAVAKFLLDHGADPNIRFQYGDTALLWAAYTRHAGLFTTLLERGADGTARDMFGNSLFALAVHGAKGARLKAQPRSDLLPIVQTLIAGGLIDRSNATLTALQVVAEHDDYAVIKTLIEGGFDPTVNAGETPLLVWAVKHGYTDLAKTMLDKGAPVNVESKQCETPLLAAVSDSREYRLELNRKAMVALLLQHGAKPQAKNKRGVDAFKAAASLKVYQKDAILNLLMNAAAPGTSPHLP